MQFCTPPTNTPLCETILYLFTWVFVFRQTRLSHRGVDVHTERCHHPIVVNPDDAIIVIESDAQHMLPRQHLASQRVIVPFVTGIDL